MLILSENLKNHFKISTLTIVSISEDFQKKFLIDFKTKKTEELMQILESELWT